MKGIDMTEQEKKLKEQIAELTKAYAQIISLQEHIKEIGKEVKASGGKVKAVKKYAADCAKASVTKTQEEAEDYLQVVEIARS
jgi:predicted  nucleic acid-binding Zn-ribbon protein